MSEPLHIEGKGRELDCLSISVSLSLALCTIINSGEEKERVKHYIVLIACSLRCVCSVIVFLLIDILCKTRDEKKKMQSNELYIGNLDLNAKPEELREIFQLYGTINRCEVKVGNTSKRILLNIY
jgi:hypothetical protein